MFDEFVGEVEICENVSGPSESLLTNIVPFPRMSALVVMGQSPASICRILLVLLPLARFAFLSPLLIALFLLLLSARICCRAW